MIGTAEDHHSNPLKIAISKLKRGGGRFVSVNPVRTGYSAIADEWVPIRPGTDGAFLLAVAPPAGIPNAMAYAGAMAAKWLIVGLKAGSLTSPAAPSLAHLP